RTYTFQQSLLSPMPFTNPPNSSI
ncbi:hypothetical protein AB1N83_008401, partial [Pleurotus pulmonarius]